MRVFLIQEYLIYDNSVMNLIKFTGNPGTCKHLPRMITVLAFFLFSSFPVCGFSLVKNSIDLEKIPLKKVRDYIEEREIDHLKEFSLLLASCEKETIEPGLYFCQQEFYIGHRFSEVWSGYRGIDPLKAWNRKSLRFGIMISKHTNGVTYPDSESPVRVETGQVYFLNLRILWGLIKVPVAFEIINIDRGRRLVEYSYIDNNKARGKHILEFHDDGKGGTSIIHRSYFKSESSFRDRYLYPVFHKKFVREFHRNMREMIEDEYEL